MPATHDMVYDVEEAGFDERVVAESSTRPVVVDFWAPWCGPCRMLSPVLDKVVRSFEGAMALAKVNVDRAPALAAKYGVQGIPSVKVFRDGRVEAEFVGAVGEADVRRILSEFVPSEADVLASRGAELAAGGRADEAEAAYREALAKEADHAGALAGLALIAMERGELAEARKLASRVPPGSADTEVAERMLAWVGLREECDSLCRGLPHAGRAVEGRIGGPEARTALERLVAERPDDLEAAYALAVCLASSGHYEAALQKLLGIVRRDRHRSGAGRAGAAKEAMLKVFAVVGKRSDLADEYRGKLAQALY